MFEDYIKKVEELRKANESFATAIVVRRIAPSSGKAGDKAVINKYGEISGWIGGGCTQSIVLREAEIAMQEGKPRLVRISPDGEEVIGEGITAYKMTCYSGGTVEVFIEPVLPRPHLIVLGKSAIGRALARLGKAMDYRVTAIATDATLDTFPGVDELRTQMDLKPVKRSPASFMVVATQGEQDELALEEALNTEAPYIAFIASRKKRHAVFQYLTEKGFSDDRLKEIQSPAGLDINAKLPEEVAVSILAQIIQVMRSKPINFVNFDRERTVAAKPKLYINPVCGVPVDMATARHILEYEGEKVYFCCDGCKVKFEQNPSQYMEKVELNRL